MEEEALTSSTFSQPVWSSPCEGLARENINITSLFHCKTPSNSTIPLALPVSLLQSRKTESRACDLLQFLAKSQGVISDVAGAHI